jgi:hypothetical protein
MLHGHRSGLVHAHEADGDPAFDTSAVPHYRLQADADYEIELHVEPDDEAHSTLPVEDVVASTQDKVLMAEKPSVS